MRSAFWLILVGVIGCSSTSAPIIDKRGVNMTQYKADLAECTEYSSAVNVVKGTAKGTAVGAAAGAAAGAIRGDAAEGAGYGAITGSVRSGIKNHEEKARVVKRCLNGRGYKVLN